MAEHLEDLPHEIHLPIAKFQNGVPQPDLADIQRGFSELYKECTPPEFEDQRTTIAEEYWTITLAEMAHCAVKKYGDVNNLDKRRLNMHERVIESIMFIPPGCMVDQYPLGGIFTMNPFGDVVVGYVFTAWKDVSTLEKNGITHIAKFAKMFDAPPPRLLTSAPFLTKSKAGKIIQMDTATGPREMFLYISNEGMGANAEYGVILQDAKTKTCYRLDLIKLRETKPKESPSLLPSFGSFFEYISTQRVWG
jgi:hypothetical protein